MLTLELSALVLEIPNDAYTTLSRNLIGCSTLRQEYLQADWLIGQNNEKATLHINMPYSQDYSVADSVYDFYFISELFWLKLALCEY